MTRLSLRLRSALLALLALAIFIPVTVLTLDKAYTESLTQAKHNELKLMNLALVSAFELDGDVPYMPELLYEEQLNLPDSGYIGIIVFRNKVVWKSASALHNEVIATLPAPATGDEEFITEDRGALSNTGSYFSYAFTAEFAAAEASAAACVTRSAVATATTPTAAAAAFAASATWIYSLMESL